MIFLDRWKNAVQHNVERETRVIQILGWIVAGISGFLVMLQKGYSPVLGILIGLALGPLSLVIAAFLPSRNGSGNSSGESLISRELQVEKILTSHARDCPECGRESSHGNKFCPGCDYRFENEADEPVDEEIESPLEDESGSTFKYKYRKIT